MNLWGLWGVLSLAAVPITAICAATPSSSVVVTKVTPAYWRVTFSDEPFNAQGNAWYEGFYRAIDQIASDGNVKVVVFDSSAEHFWISHFDLVQSVSPGYTGAAWWGNITRLVDLPIVTVAAVRGIARGGGAELASALDVSFASKEKAVFGQIEVGIGVVPGDGGLELLPRLVGRSRTIEIVLGADDFDADTAAQNGWINRAISDEQFEQFVDRFARRVASWDHYAIRVSKSIINKRSGFPTAEEHRESYEAFLAAAGQGAVPGRIAAMTSAGMQSNLTFEIKANTEILRFTGPGPWES